MRSRRGLSTVVGAVFFIIATTTVITYVSYSMNSIDKFSQSVIVSESQNVDRGREEIEISQVMIDNGKFNMTVSNTGSLPVHLTRLWVTENDLVSPSDKKENIDIRINPGYSTYNIGQSTGISVDSAKSYTLKAVTERGNIATFLVSPKVSTRVQLLTPAEVTPGEYIHITSLITNNSTTPNNIANLIPLMINNGSLTEINGPLPPSVKILPQGHTAAFNWTYKAPSSPTGLSFNGSYTGAPNGSFSISNVTVTISSQSDTASTSQWSQAASRVGILISGIPNPIETSNSGGSYKWGIGIINPLDRPVDIYAVSISTPGFDYLGGTVTGYEPLDSNWRLQTAGNNIILWEGGATPLSIPPKSVAQFRVTSQGSSIGTAPTEFLFLIQALSSEGKLSVNYPVAAKSTFSTINVFYTSDPLNPSTNWGYLIKNIPSGKITQIFNATVENASITSHNSKVKLIILIPSDFTNVIDVTAGTGGWDNAVISSNPDGSHVITVQTSAKPFTTGFKTFQFSATVPTVSDTKLYVFQTTSIYVDWVLTDSLQTASALSEAGVQVNP